MRVRRLRWIALGAIVGLLAWFGWRRFTAPESNKRSTPMNSTPMITSIPEPTQPDSGAASTVQTDHGVAKPSVEQATKATAKKTAKTTTTAKKTTKKTTKKVAKKTTKKTASNKTTKKVQRKSADDPASTQ